MKHLHLQQPANQGDDTCIAHKIVKIITLWTTASMSYNTCTYTYKKTTQIQQ